MRVHHYCHMFRKKLACGIKARDYNRKLQREPSTTSGIVLVFLQRSPPPLGLNPPKQPSKFYASLFTTGLSASRGEIYETRTGDRSKMRRIGLTNFPHCGSSEVYTSSPKMFEDWFPRFFLMSYARCHECFHRHLRPVFIRTTNSPKGTSFRRKRIRVARRSDTADSQPDTQRSVGKCSLAFEQMKVIVVELEIAQQLQ
jgi:hypothetical protein